MVDVGARLVVVVVLGAMRLTRVISVVVEVPVVVLLPLYNPYDGGFSRTKKRTLAATEEIVLLASPGRGCGRGGAGRGGVGRCRLNSGFGSAARGSMLLQTTSRVPSL